MTAHLVILVSLSGTYAVEGSLEPIEVRVGTSTETCYPLRPGATFSVEGPAEAELVVWIDLPKKPKRPKPVPLRLDLAGTSIKKRLKPKRARGAAYAPAQKLPPSRASAAIEISVPDGRRLLSIVLPKKRTGCVALRGLELRIPASAAEVAMETPEPPADEEALALAPPPAPAPEAAAVPSAASQPTEPELVPPDTATAEATPEPALEPPPQGADTDVHEIRAAEIGEPAAVEAVAEASADAPGEVGDFLRFGPKIGGVLPRAELQPGFSLSLLIDVPFQSVGVPASFLVGGLGADLSLYFEGGWSPMRNQEVTLIPGRGRTELIQNSLVLPFDLGVRLRMVFGTVAPFVGVGFAADYTRTELQAFSTPPVQQNDLALGAAVAGGVALRVGPGDITAELRYRETRADFGDFDEIAEDTLASAALHLGYIIALGR